MAMIVRKTVVVLDTPTGEHIHLFSVFENILQNMQDARRRDRHVHAHHYKNTIGIGDVKIHIENMDGLTLSDCETHLEEMLTAEGAVLSHLNQNFVKEPEGDEQWMILDAGETAISTLKSVLPKRKGSRRVRSYVDAEAKTRTYIENDERLIRHLSEITQKVLGFDLTHHSEHLGNIYFLDNSSPVLDIDVTGTI